MTWQNEKQTLTKCEKCGRFVNEGDAYYRKINNYDVVAFCDEKCAKEYFGE